MDVVLIRHGQSGNNLIWERTGGSAGRSADPSLTDLGHQQADAVAEALAAGLYGPPPTHLYASLMLRAVQTAAPIAAALDLPLLGHRDIFEVMGPVEHDGDTTAARPHPGGSRTDLTALTERLVWPGADAPGGAPPEGPGWWDGPVEQLEQVPERAARVLAGLIQAHQQPEPSAPQQTPDGTGPESGPDAGPDSRQDGDATDGPVLGLVSHGTFGQYLLRALLEVADMTGWIALGNTSVSRFRYVGDPDRPTIATHVGREDHLRAAGVPTST